jgi:hypothetical protein
MMCSSFCCSLGCHLGSLLVGGNLEFDSGMALLGPFVSHFLLFGKLS